VPYIHARPPSLQCAEDEMQPLNLPVAMDVSTAFPPTTILASGWLGPSLPSTPDSPKSPTVAQPTDRPPLPPVYSPSLRSSSGASSSSSLSSKAGLLVNAAYERALDRQESGELELSDPAESDASRWRCW